MYHKSILKVAEIFILFKMTQNCFWHKFSLMHTCVTSWTLLCYCLLQYHLSTIRQPMWKVKLTYREMGIKKTQIKDISSMATILFLPSVIFYHFFPSTNLHILHGLYKSYSGIPREKDFLQNLLISSSTKVFITFYNLGIKMIYQY